MTGPGDVSRETPSTWREYQDIISHVRSQYLATVQAAREQREATTGYAFDEFAAVERRAWHTYHEAGRRAWANYQASQQEQPPPLPTRERPGYPYPISDESALSVGLPTRHSLGVLAAWDELEEDHGLNCPECGIPWRQPSPLCPRLVYDVHPRQPAFTPHPGNGLNGEPDQWPGNYLAAPPRPETES